MTGKVIPFPSRLSGTLAEPAHIARDLVARHGPVMALEIVRNLLVDAIFAAPEAVGDELTPESIARVGARLMSNTSRFGLMVEGYIANPRAYLAAEREALAAPAPSASPKRRKRA